MVGGAQVVGFSLGADDYVTKPFSMKVLLQRIKALQRRRHSTAEAGTSDIIQHLNLSIDRKRHRAYVNGRELDLTPTEYRLLECILCRRRAAARTVHRAARPGGGADRPAAPGPDPPPGSRRRSL